jgi:hypothetical protein
MDTNYFEDELWKCEKIETEARQVLHNIHISLNRSGGRINFETLTRPANSSIEPKADNEITTFLKGQ